MASESRPVTFLIRYRNPNGSYTFGRTSSAEIAAACAQKGWEAVPGGLYADADVRREILAARKEADVNFDGGWDNDCTKGRTCPSSSPAWLQNR
jgi:hypothetical protein